jgi:hypothetical protein
MATKIKKNNILQIIGNPRTIDKELGDFRKSAMVLSSQRKHLISKYPEQWVAIHQGRVKAHSNKQEEVLSQIDHIGLPRKQVIVRFITKKPRAMIL